MNRSGDPPDTQRALDLLRRLPGMDGVVRIIELAAPRETTVLITGENGTGKEVVACAVHEMSPRRQRPFVAVNTGGIPDVFLESELFGHVRGAFTGADCDRPGKLSLANGGSLFLDEIGDMDARLQVKLLRVIQEREYEVLGSSRPHRADIRIIAATHRDLRRLITEGRFREDLFYRLNVIPIHVPPLRERRDDILPLVAHFLQLFGVEGSLDEVLSPRSQALLQSYPWPGNVRELRNVIERGVVLRQAPVLELERYLPDIGWRSHPVLPPPRGSRSRGRPPKRVDFEYIQMMVEAGVSVAEIARRLGVSRALLYRRLGKPRGPMPPRPSSR